jgi:hypothetical protein
MRLLPPLNSPPEAESQESQQPCSPEVLQERVSLNACSAQTLTKRRGAPTGGKCQERASLPRTWRV